MKRLDNHCEEDRDSELQTLKNLVVKLEVNLVSQKRDYLDQIQQLNRRHQEEIDQMTLEFNNAKRVGQEQINQLVE